VPVGIPPFQTITVWAAASTADQCAQLVQEKFNRNLPLTKKKFADLYGANESQVNVDNFISINNAPIGPVIGKSLFDEPNSERM
jgi:hypothetical protein